MRYTVRCSAVVEKFAADARGATAIEYGLIASGIAIAIISAAGLVGDELAGMFGSLQIDLANG